MSTEEPISIEDLVRTATRAGATLVRDIRPLAAPEPARPRLRRRPRRAPRRWGSWGIPLAAAAAVVLVAVGLVAVRSADSGAPAAHPATAAPATAPRYFAVLDYQETAAGDTVGSGALIVGDDITGQTIATVNPPRGMQFDEVQGGSDDRAFVVEASPRKAPQGPPETWYLLRITPGTAHPYQLAELHVRLPGSGAGALAFALSPDDRELAVESLAEAGTDGDDSVVTLGVYSVSSGAELRAWTTRKISTAGVAKDTLSWLPGGRQLAFSDIPLGGPLEDQLRTLDLTASGTDLMAASRAVLTVKIPGSNRSTCWTMRLTPDGGTVICGTQFAYLDGPTANADCANGGLELTAYSARTGQPERVLYQYRTAGGCHNGLTNVLWTDSSASSVVGATEINLEDQGGQQVGQLGVITDGHLRPLKLPKSVSPLDYLVIAF